MKIYFKLSFTIWLISQILACNSQPSSEKPVQKVQSNYNPKKLVGGGCDGCELMYIGIPKNINHVDTSAAWSEKGRKLLVIGKVFKIDGKTPAPNVIIYYWQTDNAGFYAQKPGLDPIAKRHGYVRGWVKTDKDGNYALYTIKPAPYPNDNIPSHIHTSIKEPNVKDEYYIDEFVFDDDPLLTTAKRKALENRGGSGILRVVVKGELLIAEHNIVLGLNVPNYPENNPARLISGLEIGEDNPSFIPYHAYGPDKGTRTCPVCKYGRYHGIVYFVGNKPNWVEIKKWLAFLEKESENRAKYLKAYFVYGNEKSYSKETRKQELEKLGEELSLKNVALTFVPSMKDVESEVNLNKINPEVENTFIIYRHRSIIDKFIDLEANKVNFDKISTTLDRTKSEYFNLSEPKYE
jgi:protocatechuate 3,4-dioxygenase, beta subunit